jgi:hypothetical protein
MWLNFAHFYCKLKIFLQKLSVNYNGTSWFEKITFYNWRKKSKTHKHYNYLQAILKQKLLIKVINNEKLEGLGKET